MITKYAVIRYMPRPLSGESINIGVVAWTEGKIVTKFVDNWQRVRGFGRENIDFLREFALSLESSTPSQRTMFGLESGSVDVPKLEKIVANWGRSIVFTEPRASLKLPEDVLREVTQIYLLESQHRHRARDRRTAAALALEAVSAVLTSERGPNAAELIRKQRSIHGKIERHIFDVVVENGHPFFAAQGLSFEKSSTVDVQKDVDATAWAIDDIRESAKFKSLPVAVLALPPNGRSSAYTSAKKIFRALEVQMIAESGMQPWVKKTMKVLPPPSSRTLSA